MSSQPGIGFRLAVLADRLLALVLLLVLSPVMLLVALVIRLDTPGPVFYRQERVGLNRRDERDRRAPGRDRERRNRPGDGRPFKIWKFRTMVRDAEQGTGPVWALDNDPRVTRVGRVLRLTRVDELPQLVNVLRGEMRLVGPRPERPQFVHALSERVPEYRRRLSVPPGITGLAQVEREYDADLDDVRTKLRYDLFYIQNRRPSMDIKILLKTLSVVLRGRGR